MMIDFYDEPTMATNDDEATVDETQVTHGNGDAPTDNIDLQKKRDILAWVRMCCCVGLALGNLGLFFTEGKWISLVFAVCWGCIGVAQVIAWRQK